MPRRPPEVTIDPLTEAELSELQGVLAAGDGLGSVHRMYGAFAALATGPWLVPPGAWLPVVIGESSLVNMEHAQRVLGLVMRAYNSVLDALAEAREVVPPADAPEDVVVEWCAGYFDFARRDGDWGADEVGVELLVPFGLVSGDLRYREMSDANAKAERTKARTLLGRHARELYDYWAPRRREGTLPPPRAKPRPAKPARKKRRH